jgi:hypothetical protein
LNRSALVRAGTAALLLFGAACSTGGVIEPITSDQGHPAPTPDSSTDVGHDSRPDAAPVSPFAGRFVEQERLHLDAPGKIWGHFTADHTKVQRGGSLPSSIQMSGDTVTFSARGGIVVANPARDAPFYRVEVTLVDAGVEDLRSFLTAVDALWGPGVDTRGLSVGIDTAQSSGTYWYEHTELDRASPAWSVEYGSRWSRFVRRRNGEIPLALYVTPSGIYAMADGVNFGSLPSLAIGSYTFHSAAPLGHLVLGKWDDGGAPVTFRGLRVLELDAAVSTVEEVNAFFLQQTLKSAAFKDLLKDDASMNGTGGFQNALWVAFLYRGYDHLFGADHAAEIQAAFDAYLQTLPAYLDEQLPRYGKEQTIHVNHSLINSLQSNTVVTFALLDVLRPEQREEARRQFARLVDASLQHLKADGSFPATVHYKKDTFAEEVSWLISLYAGYLACFPSDAEGARAERLRETLTFLGIHHLSTGGTLAQAHPEVSLAHLGEAFPAFDSQYIWPDGAIDNHDFHPSLNYASGVVGTAALARVLLARRGIVIPTLTRNLDLAYNRSVKGLLDPATLRLNAAVPRWDAAGEVLAVEQDRYVLAPAGFVIDFVGHSAPSRVEDWGVTFTGYNVLESYGDYALADAVATTAYHLYYSGSGRLFCGHVDTGNGQKCAMGTDNFYNFLFGPALYAMLLSERSTLPTPTAGSP